MHTTYQAIRLHLIFAFSFLLYAQVFNFKEAQNSKLMSDLFISLAFRRDFLFFRQSSCTIKIWTVEQCVLRFK